MITKTDIERWLKEAPKNATHMVVVCDTFDYEDYPVYVTEGQDVHRVKSAYSGNMQRVMEVYNLKKNIKEQLSQTGRVFNY